MTIQSCWRWSDKKIFMKSELGQCRWEEHCNGTYSLRGSVKRCAESWEKETEEVERVVKEALESEKKYERIRENRGRNRIHEK